MHDYPSDIGHWERINESAGLIIDRPLNLPLIVQDMCRALLDLHREIREAKAEAWDKGHRFTGYEPAPGENPYRKDNIND